jgi:hypothetical protein
VVVFCNLLVCVKALGIAHDLMWSTIVGTTDVEAIENLEGAHQCSYMPAAQGSNEKKYYLLRSHLNSEILIIKANVARAGTSINGRGNIMFLCS